LGVTRLLVKRLVRVFPHMCKEFYPVCDTVTATCRVGNRRFEHMHRRGKTCTLAPGYVQCDRF